MRIATVQTERHRNAIAIHRKPNYSNRHAKFETGSAFAHVARQKIKMDNENC